MQVCFFAQAVTLCISVKLAASMPLVYQNRHPRSMDYANGEKVYVLRTIDKMKWKDIRLRAVCLDKKTHPSISQCVEHVKKFSRKAGCVEYKYANCGRKPWKVTKDVETFLVRRLLALRTKMICTSTTLQTELAREKGLSLSTSAIRKVLLHRGYKWLPRSQKPKYSKDEKLARVAFADEVLAYSVAELAKEVAMSMDGVVLTLPPNDKTERENYCKIGYTHIYRKPGEKQKPELTGGNGYAKQVPYARQCPMWGGIGKAGFGLVMFHQFRKVDQIAWRNAVTSGELKVACQEASGRWNGPWTILCDNESFLNAPASRSAHAKHRFELWHVPPRSPDLNPVELFWAKVRLWLRHMDLKDLREGRPPVQKTALKERVRRLLRTAKAKQTAKNIFASLRKRALRVKSASGAAITG